MVHYSNLLAYLDCTLISSTSLDTPEWKSSIAQPSLPYVLKMLTGLCHWHSKTQEALLTVVDELHLLEQVASDQHIGTLAENLLEAMMENKACQDEVFLWSSPHSIYFKFSLTVTLIIMFRLNKYGKPLVRKRRNEPWPCVPRNWVLWGWR